MAKNHSADSKDEPFDRDREANRARKALEELYFNEGEEAVQRRHDVLKELQEEARNKVASWKKEQDVARRAARSVEHLTERFTPDAQPMDKYFTHWILYGNDEEVPDRYATEVPGENDIAHWRVEETEEGSVTLFATTEEGSEVFRAPQEITFEELHERAKDEWRQLRGKFLEAQQKAERREIWLATCKDLLGEIATDSVGTGADTDDAVQKKDAIEIWEENAAKMYACFHNHGAPDYLSDVDKVVADEGGLDSFSHDHTWRTLQEKGWALSKGNIQALVEALERWADHFEGEHGELKADWAAGPFDWPTGDEQES